MVMIKFIKDQLASKEKEKAQLKQKYESELKFLRNQTNPHFLMNALNNIYALARKKSDNTAEVVMRLSEMLRFMLYESDGRFISLSDEIRLVENYLELEMIRYDNRLSLSFNKEVDADCYKITPLLLLPFVENAFKHGISETRFESFIYIDLSVKKGQLVFLVENTKDRSQENNKKNIGLINARRQLELLYKDHLLDVRENGSSFIVNLTVNLNSYVEI
jgi:LytS/YehU family sensor histidine kinase